MLRNRILVLFLTVVVFLAGCSAPVYNQTENNVADVKLKQMAVRADSAKFLRPTPPLVVNQGLYVDHTPISIAKQPSWLLNSIVIRGTQLPFSYYSRTVVSGGNRNVMIHNQAGLDQTVQISMNYSGTIKGALDMLAAKTGYVYSVSGNHVYWQAFITRTFDIAFMPGASDYMMGKSSGGGASASQTTATGGSVTGIIDDSAASQYSNLKGTLSIWKDLDASIKQMLSADGKVVVSEATTSVTVRDRPANVNLIARFIANINNNLSRQVLVKVQLLDVTLENDFNFGINWEILQGNFHNQLYQLISNNGVPIAITQSATSLSNQLTTLGVKNNSGSTGVTTLINSLKQQGKVSLVTEPMVLAQNNQVSVIRLVEQKGYLASVQTTTLAGSSTGGQITSQITPGQLVTGLTLYVLPKIMGNKVYLQINGDLSSDRGFQTITSNGSTPGTPAATNASIIQVPNVQQKQFNQRTVVCSGDTLILSGFRQVLNSAGASQLFDSQALGGRTSRQISAETIVLITPIILNGTA